MIKTITCTKCDTSDWAAFGVSSAGWRSMAARLAKEKVTRNAHQSKPWIHIRHHFLFLKTLVHRLVSTSWNSGQYELRVETHWHSWRPCNGLGQPTCLWCNAMAYAAYMCGCVHPKPHICGITNTKMYSQKSGNYLMSQFYYITWEVCAFVLYFLWLYKNK